MTQPLENRSSNRDAFSTIQGKSSVEEIRARFDADVERFSNLETGQTATVDARLQMDLIVEAASRVTPQARRVLDVGCGAGNFSLRLLEKLSDLDVTLVDLSQPMLDRAKARVGQATRGQVTCHQADIRELTLPSESFDIILAAAVLHHLRTAAEWESVFGKLIAALNPGGGLWIFDLVEHTLPGVQQAHWARYATYLEELKGAEYRDHVLAYIAQEDTPAPLLWQLDLLRACGLTHLELLHKHLCFAAFGGVKR